MSVSNLEAPVFYIKQGDTLPALEVTLQNGDGTTPDLSTAERVVFTMSDSNGVVKLDEVTAHVVGSPLAGVVAYNWGPNDLAVADNYAAEFDVYYPGGKATFPNGVNIKIVVAPAAG